VDVSLEVKPGNLYNFGDISIIGHEEFVKERVVQNALNFHEGELYSRQKIDESRRNLFNLSIFKTAVIRPQEVVAGEHNIPMNVYVEPRKKQSVKFGVGYGTDDGIRLQASWTYRNLTRRADRLSFHAKRSDIIHSIRANYVVPYFMSKKNSLAGMAGYEHEKTDYYTTNKTRAEVSIIRNLSRHWLTSVGYNFEINNPEDIKIGEDPDEPVDQRDLETYLVSSVRAVLERTTIDDLLNSTEGYSVTGGVEQASAALGSEVDFFRPLVGVKGFMPLKWDMVLGLRTEISTIQETEDTDYIPLSWQYFLGGSRTVRGYSYEEMGVVDRNDVLLDVSGYSSLTANVELRYPIWKELSGVLFVDMGALNQESYKFDLNAMRYSTGCGLRYHTIIGPLQLDFGYKLNPPKSVIVDNPLLLDLLNSDRWRVHFNIGQTF
jgi:outer membrane protein assembly factor BamA